MVLRTWLLLAISLLLAPGLVRATEPEEPLPGATVYLVQPADGVDLAVLGGALAGAQPGSVFLLDSPEATVYLRTFLSEWKPRRLVVVSHRSGAGESVSERFGRQADAVLTPSALLDELFPTAPEVVVCPSEPVGQLLQAVCLAGVRNVPLFVVDDKGLRLSVLLDTLGRRQTERITLVGAASKLRPWLGGWGTTHLADTDAVQVAHVRDLGKHTAISTLVLTNPYECLDAPQTMAALAPWLALRKRAVLRFTRTDGEDAAEVVERALREPRLAKAEYLILAGSPRAVPPEMRSNPIPGDRDRQIEVEPTTPRDPGVACSLAVGRLFHPDRAIVPLMQGRQHALRHDLRNRTPRVLVASNAGGGLPLLEMFSRATIEELRNVGWSVTATIGNNVGEDEVRRQMRRHDIFLWEGHQSTLIHGWGYPRWAETTPPQLVVLQSCLALEEAKVLPILARGAIGVVGTSTRMYSGSGGASSLAFFDALAYDGQSLGGALRQAKNLLLAYARLKEQRLTETSRTGANIRAAFAFTLWGDPTFYFSSQRESKVSSVRATVVKDRIVLQVPEERLPELTTQKYKVTMPANGRLAGLLHAAVAKDKPQEMVPLLFAEVPLKFPGGDLQPRLSGQLAASRRVLLYDSRRERGYLLLVPASTDGAGEFKFRVLWESAEMVNEPR